MELLDEKFAQGKQQDRNRPQQHASTNDAQQERRSRFLPRAFHIMHEQLSLQLSELNHIVRKPREARRHIRFVITNSAVSVHFRFTIQPSAIPTAAAAAIAIRGCFLNKPSRSFSHVLALLPQDAVSRRGAASAGSLCGHIDSSRLIGAAIDSPFYICRFTNRRRRRRSGTRRLRSRCHLLNDVIHSSFCRPTKSHYRQRFYHPL